MGVNFVVNLEKNLPHHQNFSYGALQKVSAQ